MPNWLVEDLNLIAILLGVLAVVLGFLWLRDHTKRLLIAAGVLGLLAMGTAVLWFYLMTDHRSLKRKVEEMTAGIPADLEKTFNHISGSFRYGIHDKRALRQVAQETIQKRNVTEVRVWDVKIEKVDRATKQAEVGFNFRIQGNWSTGIEYFFCRAVFVLDADGEWRMTKFEVFQPQNVKEPLTIPGL